MALHLRRLVRDRDPAERPLLVGESNPFGGPVDFALWPEPRGCSGDRLCRLILVLTREEYLKRYDRVNLCGGAWNAAEARQHARRLLVDGTSPLVMLGVFDPPYLAYERLYGDARPVAFQVAEWCAEHPQYRIVLCGHVGDYEMVLPRWRVVRWSRGKYTYAGKKTTDMEAMFLSPACDDVRVEDKA